MGFHALAFLAGNLLMHGLAGAHGVALWWCWPLLLAWLFRRARILGSFALGALITAASIDAAQTHRWPDHRHGEIQRMQLVIDDFARLQNWGGRTVAARVVGGVDGLRRVQALFPPWLGQPVPGQRWQVRAVLNVPDSRASPHAFDRERQFARQQLDALAMVDDGVLLSHRPHSVSRMRALFASGLVRSLDPTAADWMRALLLGDRRGLDERTVTLQRTGTAHLMAISGMHVGMVAAVAIALAHAALWLFAGLMKRTARRQWALLAGAVAALLYAAMAGFSLPTIRALLMLFVVLGLLWLRWRWSAGEVLAAALVVVLLFDPLASIGVGFWLSFSAVALLFVLALQPLQQGAWRRLWQVQWRLPLLMAPVSALFFGFVSLLAPVANLLAVPVVTLIVLPMACLGAVCWLLFGWAMLLAGAGEIMQGLFVTLGWLEQTPFAVWQPAARPWPVLLLLAAGLIGMAMPLSWRLRSSLALMILPWALNSPSRPASGEWQARLYDVGHGQALAIATRQHLVLYDTGPGWSSDATAFEAVVEPDLRAEGWSRVRLLVLSQMDNHHAGGLDALTAAWPVDEIRLPPGHSSAKQPCRAGETWWLDEVRFTLLHPAETLPPMGDDSSCVLLVEGAYHGLLVMGDAGRAVEPRVLRSLGGKTAQVLVVGRHGAGTATSERLLDTVRARHLLVAGDRPNWQPHGHGPFISTSQRGTVTVTSTSARTLTVKGWREQAPRWWRQPGSDSAHAER